MGKQHSLTPPGRQLHVARASFVKSRNSMVCHAFSRYLFFCITFRLIWLQLICVNTLWFALFLSKGQIFTLV